jgi:fumarate reductase subunit D
MEEENQENTKLNSDDLESLTGVDETRLFAAMAYLFILVIAPLSRYKNDAFVNFHIRQGILLSTGLVLSIMTAAWWNTLGSFLFVVFLMMDVVAMVMALQGRRWKVPVVGNLAEKISI